MSEGQSAEFEIEYQVYGSEEQESEMNGNVDSDTVFIFCIQ